MTLCAFFPSILPSIKDTLAKKILRKTFRVDAMNETAEIPPLPGLVQDHNRVGYLSSREVSIAMA